MVCLRRVGLRIKAISISLVGLVYLYCGVYLVRYASCKTGGVIVRSPGRYFLICPWAGLAREPGNDMEEASAEDFSGAHQTLRIACLD
jgi:hypothetical protein